MKLVLLIIFLIAGYFPVLSQITDKALQIEQVQTAAAKLVGHGHQTNVMLRDLSELEGSVVSLTIDSFGFKIKSVKGKKFTALIKYSDVLEIKSKDVSLSFVPPESSPQYSSWDEVAKISYNNNLQVVIDSGETLTGRSGEIKKDSLTLINDLNNEKLVLQRDRILFVYRVRNQAGKTGDGAGGGARKGGEVGREIGETRSGKAFSSALGTLIGAGVGALSGTAKNEKKLRVLIYSK